MRTVWDENTIRKELARLDGITGLSGAELPIRFTDARCIIGCYHGDKGGRFSFSRSFLMDPELTNEQALNLIRHEYAHYMDHMIYGNVGHSVTWKICCGMVGASPLRCYNAWMNDYYKDKQAALRQKLDEMLEYRSGDSITHPVYGEGRIKGISGEGISQAVQVAFKSAGLKTLNLAWVNDNCGKGKK